MYHSPYTRTIQTTTGIRKHVKEQLVRAWPDSRLREQELGNLQDDRHADEFRREQLKVGRFYYRFPDGESGADVYDRVSAWWDGLRTTSWVKLDATCTEQWAKSTLVVVTHGITMRLILMQLYDWSPNTFHSIWNANNCDMVVLDKDLSCNRHYRINKELSDPIRSSIDIMVTLKEKEGKQSRKMVFAHNAPKEERDDRGLDGWLEVPQPRSHQHSYIKKMVYEQFGEKHGFGEEDISRVEGHGPFHLKYTMDHH